jgi:hypothetical protein
MGVRRVSCTLTFWSWDLTTTQMSAIAGIRPDASADRNRTCWGAIVARETAFWEVTSRSEQNAPLEVHLTDLLARVRESWDGLLALRERVDDCQLLMAIHSSLRDGDSEGCHLELDQVAVLGALRAEADFEIYIEDDV